jgi:hypothetical protein
MDLGIVYLAHDFAFVNSSRSENSFRLQSLPEKSSPPSSTFPVYVFPISSIHINIGFHGAIIQSLRARVFFVCLQTLFIYRCTKHQSQSQSFLLPVTYYQRLFTFTSFDTTHDDHFSDDEITTRTSTTSLLRNGWTWLESENLLEIPMSQKRGPSTR